MKHQKALADPDTFCKNYIRDTLKILYYKTLRKLYVCKHTQNYTFVSTHII